jgi:outer membrane protein TolC
MLRIYLSLLIVTGTLWGQEYVPKSLENCLRQGLENNKQLIAARVKTEGSLASASLARSAMLPSLKMSAGYTKLSEVPAFEIIIPSFPSPKTMTISEPVLDNYSLKLTLQQPIFTGGKLSAQNRASREIYLADSSDYEQLLGDVALNIRILYWRLYQAVRVKELADENISLLEEHLRDIDNLGEQGMATKNDRLKVELQLSNAALMRIEAANNLTAIGIQLNNIMGEPLEDRIEPTSVPDTARMVIPDIAEMLETARIKRADLRSLESRKNAADMGKKAVRAGWYPQIYAIGNYTYADPNQRIFPVRDKFDETWDLGVMLSMDIWDWQSTKHRERQASAAYRQTQIQLSVLKDAIDVEIRLCLLDLDKCGQKLDVTSTGSIQAEENHRIMKNLFLQGMATNSDLLDAEVLLLQAKVNSAAAGVEYQIAKDRLQKAIGEI